MLPWIELGKTVAPDGEELLLRRRGHEFLIVAGGLQLMSSEDDASSNSLAELGCAHIDRKQKALVLVGGLGMGFTLRSALSHTGANATIEIAEFVSAVVEWNREHLGHLADKPLDEPRVALHVCDVAARIRRGKGAYDAILLDVDNGPDALAHEQNNALYGKRGLAEAWAALKPGGVYGVWSFSDDPGFTKRLERQGFATKVNRVTGSRKGRGRYHYIWIAQRPKGR